MDEVTRKEIDALPRMKTAESFQYTLFEIVSTRRPMARSLSPTMAFGVAAPGLVPAV